MDGESRGPTIVVIALRVMKPARETAVAFYSQIGKLSRVAGYYRTMLVVCVSPALPRPVPVQLCSHNVDRVPWADRAGLDDFGIDATEIELSSERRVDELQGLRTKPLAEFLAAGMGLVGHLQDRRADGQLRTGGQIVNGEIEVDKQLVTCFWPTPPFSCDLADDPGVHQVDLHVGVRAPVVATAARSLAPRVPDQSTLDIQFTDLQDFPFILGRSPDDEFDRSPIPG